MDATLVDRWVIGLLNAFRISRDPSSLLSHHMYQPSKLQNLVVMPRLVVEVPIIIKAMSLHILQRSISILRIHSIKKVLCRISHVKPVDHSGTKGDSLSRLRLLLALHDLHGNLVSRDRDMVFMLTEVVVDDSRIRDVFITCYCKMLKTILI
ncbi:hypothetical protein ACFX16_023260 [Malus domestica]